MSENNQRRLLPSTSMLAAFDAAARAGSFTIAAQELNLTQGAISKQINALEDQLGVALFDRSHQKITLTEVGKTYARDIQSALDMIRSASSRVATDPGGGVLNLAILPTFGTRWLIPRLPSFFKENPNITISFITKPSPFDFRTEDLHTAIHYGTPNWPNADSTYLMGEEVVPVCSPDFLRDNAVTTASDLLSTPLLHIYSRPNAWPDWFKAHGLSDEGHEGMYFEQFMTAAQAAAAGLGSVLLPKFLVENELKRKELVLVLDQEVKSEYGYFLVTPHEKLDYAPVIAFREWLLHEAAISQNQLPTA